MGAESIIGRELIEQAAQRGLAELAGKEVLEGAAERLAGEAFAARIEGKAGMVIADKLLGKAAGAGTDAAAQMIERELGAGAASAVERPILAVNKARYIGQGDEGMVFSNGDGSITKVFKNADHDVNSVAGMYDRLDKLGVRLPKVLETGITAEGQPAMRFQQIGGGNNLQEQLMLQEVPPHEMAALRAQYDDMARVLNENNTRIDWNLKNMVWHDRKLWITDPSFVKDEPLGDFIIKHYRP